MQYNQSDSHSYQTFKSRNQCENMIYNQKMIFISEDDQRDIAHKIKKLPKIFKNLNYSVALFEVFGTLLLTYGICTSVYIRPIDRKIEEPTCQFLISCFLYFALSVAAPFSGGHLNPTITLSLNTIHMNSRIWYYIGGQVIGSVIGTGIAFAFFHVVPPLYEQSQGVGSVVVDGVGEMFGSFMFTFFYLYVTQTNYMAGEYFRYFLLSIFYLASRTFTFRLKFTVINPAISFSFQLFQAIQKQNAFLLLQSISLILASIAGGYLAAIFFTRFYYSLHEELERRKHSTVEDSILHAD